MTCIFTRSLVLSQCVFCLIVKHADIRGNNSATFISLLVFCAHCLLPHQSCSSVQLSWRHEYMHRCVCSCLCLQEDAYACKYVGKLQRTILYQIQDTQHVNAFAQTMSPSDPIFQCVYIIYYYSGSKLFGTLLLNGVYGAQGHLFVHACVCVCVCTMIYYSSKWRQYCEVQRDQKGTHSFVNLNGFMHHALWKPADQSIKEWRTLPRGVFNGTAGLQI